MGTKSPSMEHRLQQDRPTILLIHRVLTTGKSTIERQANHETESALLHGAAMHEAITDSDGPGLSIKTDKRYTEHTLTAAQLQALSQYVEGTADLSDNPAGILDSLLPSPKLVNEAREYAREVLAEARAEGWE